MSWRTVIVANHAKLELQLGFMVIRKPGEIQRIILDELDILLIENTAVSLTAQLIAELVKRKVRIIFCDPSRNPIAELHPYHGCHDSTRKLRTQLKWTSEAKALVWQSIVREKIRNEAKLLGNSEVAEKLRSMVNLVEPGDPSNVEGGAARIYFPALFGAGFSRDASATPINSSLNYGYMMFLAAFNRALTCHGCVTELGIFHSNVYNAYNLSSDLIEPFRVFVDQAVFEMQHQQPHFTFDKEEKRRLIQLLHEERRIAGMNQNLINAVSIYVSSVLEALESGEPQRIKYPEI